MNLLLPTDFVLFFSCEENKLWRNDEVVQQGVHYVSEAVQ